MYVSLDKKNGSNFGRTASRPRNRSSRLNFPEVESVVSVDSSWLSRLSRRRPGKTKLVSADKMRPTRVLEVQSRSVFAFAVLLQVLGLKISRPRTWQNTRQTQRTSSFMVETKAFHAVFTDTSRPNLYSIPEISGEYKK